MPKTSDGVHIILASKSAARQDMLKNAGLTFEIIPATVDEAELRGWLREAKSTGAAVAETLAAAKAREISAANPKAWVIGSDQTLEIDGELLSKPGGRDGVVETLQKLQGKSHALSSAVALAREDHVSWMYSEIAKMTMKPLSDDDIAAYADDAGEVVYGCVGAYQIEGKGAALFDKVEGTEMTIRGMPLQPLLNKLAALGAIHP